jgi:hypothetical protein
VVARHDGMEGARLVGQAGHHLGCPSPYWHYYSLYTNMFGFSLKKIWKKKSCMHEAPNEVYLQNIFY